MTEPAIPSDSSALKKITLLIVSSFLLVAGMYFGRYFFVPFLFSALLALLVLPVCEKLESFNIPRSIASLLGILLIMILIGGLFLFFYMQFLNFADDLPMLMQQIEHHLDEIVHYLSAFLHISPEEFMDNLRVESREIWENAGIIIFTLANFTFGAVVLIALSFVYIFLFLYYRDKLREFVINISPAGKKEKVGHIIAKASVLTHRYLAGMLIVSGILAVMNTIGLMIIGIPHPVFFGVLAGVLNMIPFIGTILGSVFPIIMALLTKPTIWPAVAVALVFTFNQFFEDAYLIPRIVGPKVSINPFAAIVAIVMGTLIWGVMGIILFIPMMGILKIIFDHVDGLHPYGTLLGTEKSGEKNGVRDFFSKLFNSKR